MTPIRVTDLRVSDTRPAAEDCAGKVGKLMKGGTVTPSGNPARLRSFVFPAAGALGGVHWGRTRVWEICVAIGVAGPL